MKLALLLGAALTTLARGAAADDSADLDSGKILVTSTPVVGSPEPERTVRAVVESPPSAVWKIVSDCAHYREHLPHVAASAELSRAGNTVVCQVTIAMPFPVSNLTAVTQAVHDERPAAMTRTWHLVSGDYDFNDGSWTVIPYRDGRASMVTYRIHVKPKTAVPDFIRNAAQSKALPEMMERIRIESAKVP
jgi:ribosome-associated toxin RatA of RatAB toxin-antitoxin module